MTRGRFPSDETRLRVRPHVRVHLTIENHPRYAKVFADPETRGIILGVWVIARRAHANRTGDCVTLTEGDVAWITGRRQAHRALARLSRALDAIAWRSWRDGRAVVVEVRNFARKQGLDSAAGGVEQSDSANSASLREESEKRREEERSRRTAPSAPAPLEPMTGNGAVEPDASDTLSLALIARLHESTPPRLGEVTDQDILDWYADVVPRMRDQGYHNLARASVSWWSRCTPEELKRARANGDARRLEPLRRAAESRQIQDVPPEAFDFEVEEVGARG
jgi:hypothetical protein